MEKLYDLWAIRNPEWEIKYEDSIVKTYCDYGRGTTQFQDARGKIFGAGYEIYIIAFFIGLYFNKTKPLTKDSGKKKKFGQPIQYWGNQESRLGRVSYGRIREYIFAALIARTDIDFIALDKGEITNRKVVDMLIEKMEDYANFGFDYIYEKIEDNPEYFYKESAFIRLFLSFTQNETKYDSSSSDCEPESLD